MLQEKEQAGFSERERQLKEGAQWLASHATNGSLELIDQNAPPYQPRRGSLPLIVDEVPSACCRTAFAMQCSALTSAVWLSEAGLAREWGNGGSEQRCTDAR